MLIIRDTREKPEYGWFYPPDGYCSGTIITKVDIGDYTVEGLEDFVCVERKQTVMEFAQNVVTKRWTNCLERMAKCKHSYLIFEFPWSDIDRYPMSAKLPYKVKKKLKVTGKFLRKNIYEARNKYGIHVLACSNRRKAEKAAYRILRKGYEISLRR